MPDVLAAVFFFNPIHPSYSPVCRQHTSIQVKMFINCNLFHVYYFRLCIFSCVYRYTASYPPFIVRITFCKAGR